MKTLNILLGAILIVLVLIWQKIPEGKDVYRTETTLIEPVEIAQGQEIKINGDEPLQVEIQNEPLQIESSNGNPLPVEIQR